LSGKFVLQSDFAVLRLFCHSSFSLPGGARPYLFHLQTPCQFIAATWTLQEGFHHIGCSHFLANECTTFLDASIPLLACTIAASIVVLSPMASLLREIHQKGEKD